MDAFLPVAKDLPKTPPLVFSLVQMSTAGQRGDVFLSDVSGFCLTDIIKLNFGLMY